MGICNIIFLNEWWVILFLQTKGTTATIRMPSLDPLQMLPTPLYRAGRCACLKCIYLLGLKRISDQYKNVMALLRLYSILSLSVPLYEKWIDVVGQRACLWALQRAKWLGGRHFMYVCVGRLRCLKKWRKRKRSGLSFNNLVFIFYSIFFKLF